MTARSVRVTLKQHRFELAAAVVASLAAAAFAASIAARLTAVGVPPHCIPGWLVSGADGRPECVQPMSDWANIIGPSSETLFTILGALPVAVGVLGGVPVIARELEARTAQTAWSLFGSRSEWLARQSVPIGGVVLLAVLVASITAGEVAAADAAWGNPAYIHIGLHGPLLVLRTLMSFGFGLLVGGLLGRALPGFVASAFVAGVLLFGVASLRDAWVAQLPAEVIGEAGADGEFVLKAGAITTGWGWVDIDGRILSQDEAYALVPEEIARSDDPDQPTHSLTWLEDNGYSAAVLGVPETAALGWVPYEAVILGALSFFAIAGATVLVRQRRPT